MTDQVTTVNVHDMEEVAARRALEAVVEMAKIVAVYGRAAALAKSLPDNFCDDLGGVFTGFAEDVEAIDPAQFRTDRKDAP